MLARVFVLMRFIPALLCLFALGGVTAHAASALSALQLLPPEYAQKVAVIAGRDATPEPERWHFIVFDAAEETGVREIVVTAGRKTADRTLSQFAESLTAADVIGVDAIKVDSDEVGKLALKFGVANKVSVSAMHFDLRKSGQDATPLWTVICLDSNGAELGQLLISATRGTVIMHPGFENEPPAEAMLTAAARPTPTPAVEEQRPRTTTTRKPAPRRRSATPRPTPKQGFFQRVFGR